MPHNDLINRLYTTARPHMTLLHDAADALKDADALDTLRTLENRAIHERALKAEATMATQAAEIARLRQECAELRGAMAADDERLRAAERRVWGGGLTYGCDGPEHLADEIERLRNLESLVREWQEARKPTTLAAPGEFLAEAFQSAVRRMSAADEALAAYLLDGPDDETEQCETCQQPITGQVVWSWDDVPLCEACAEVETPAAGKRAQTPNEAEMLRALSGALTGGNASTWEQVLHAAERLRDESTLLNEWIPGDPVGMNEQPRHHPSLRDELAEIIRWRFRTADPNRHASSRREDADKALVYLAGGNGRVAEHLWMPIRPPVVVPEAPGPPTKGILAPGARRQSCRRTGARRPVRPSTIRRRAGDAADGTRGEAPRGRSANAPRS